MGAETEKPRRAQRSCETRRRELRGRRDKVTEAHEDAVVLCRPPLGRRQGSVGGPIEEEEGGA